MKAIVKNEVWLSWLNWQLSRLIKKFFKFIILGFFLVENILSFMLEAKVIRKIGPGENEWENVEYKNPFVGF